MNLNFIKKFFSKVDEIAVIGRNVCIDGVVCHAAGLFRSGTVANFLLVTYDEAHCALFEQYESEEITDYGKKETNRSIRRQNILFQKNAVADSVDSVVFGHRTFETAMSSSCRADDVECRLILIELLRQGWNPEPLGAYDLENLYVETIELVEPVESLGDIDTSSLKLIRRAQTREFLTEKEITLAVGEQNREIHLQSGDSGKDYTAYINAVTLFDPWKSTEERFNDPEFLKLIPPEELPTIRAETEKSLECVCKKGMCLPIVEYECDDLFLQFYLKDDLDAVPDYSGDGATAFLVKSDKPVGQHGQPMRCSTIQTPVEPHTTEIRAEIFSVSVTVPAEDVTI